MKARLLVLLLLLGSVSAFAQKGTFSLELGTGILPLHMGFKGIDRAVNKELAQYGQALKASDSYNAPVLSLSGVWWVGRKTELLLTAGLCWRINQVIQYPEFGVDPEGKPRYLVENGTEVGWKAHSFVPSVNFIYRHLWNPEDVVVVYSGAGLGFSTVTEWVPLPTLVPFALRAGGRHFYGFLELTLGPVATLAHGGLAVRF